MKFSEILKKGGLGPSPPPSPRPEPIPAPPSQPAPARPPMPARPPEREREPATPRPSPAVNVQEQYGKLVECAAAACERVGREETIDAARCLQEIDQLLATLPSAPEAWLTLAVTRSSPKIYLPGHLVNTTIFAVDLGQAMAMEPASLQELARLAFFSDVGLARLLDLILQPRRLTTEERTQMHRHVEYGATIAEQQLRQAHGAELARLIEASHECIDGSGYPGRLKDGEIPEAARITHVLSRYEAMGHPRVWREAIPAPKVIEELCAAGRTQLDTTALSRWIASIGVYPPGTWVKLSNGEVGKVVHHHPDSPLRPVVEVHSSYEGRPLATPKLVDLGTSVALAVKEFLGCEVPPTPSR